MSAATAGRAGPRSRTAGRESEQPRWRQDFPIDWPEDDYVARREFTKFLVLTSRAFVVGQFWIGVQSLLRRGRGRPPEPRGRPAGPRCRSAAR